MPFWKSWKMIQRISGTYAQLIIIKKKRSTSVLDCKLPVENDLVKILQISAVVDISINFSFLETVKETFSCKIDIWLRRVEQI